MDEIEQEPVTTVGEQLRAAREAQGLSIEDVAASTRIPTRHLASLEMSDWSALPAPTYSMGFAKNYATAVGLDRDAIGEDGGRTFEKTQWSQRLMVRRRPVEVALIGVAGGHLCLPRELG